MIRPRLFAVLALLLALPACDTNVQQDEFFFESEQPPNGFTRTNEAGEVLDEDTDDWRVAPAFRGAVRVDPAYPNPAARNGLVTLVVTDTFGDAITGGLAARGFRNNDLAQPVLLAFDEGPGVYFLTFNPTELRLRAGDDAQLFRVRVFTQDARLVTYGDILVQ